MDRVILSARSSQDGIIFYSSQNPGLGVQAILTPEGKCKTGPIITILEDFFGLLGGGSVMNYVISKKAVIILDLVILALVCLTRNISFIFAWIYFAFLASVDVFQSISLAIAIKLGDLQRLGRFHSAEHMSVEAYNALKRVPSLDELKKYSRFSEHCGSFPSFQKSFNYSILSLFIAIGSLVNLRAYIVMMILTISLLYVVLRYKLVKYLQVFLTNKPTDEELNVAIEGLRELEMLDDNFESDCGEAVRVVVIHLGVDDLD